MAMIKRRKSREIFIGGVGVGGGHPVSVQSMTSADTADISATLEQVGRLERAGCEIVRVSAPDERAAEALAEIRGGVGIPLIADIHFDHKLALKALESGVDGLRINPGNIGGKSRVEAVVKAAKERSVPIRIGVNAGSLEKDIIERTRGLSPLSDPMAEAMVESALRHVHILEDLDFNLIKISLKASDVMTTVRAYRLMAEKCDYPLHLGVTESGSAFSGAVSSSVGIGTLLAEGIGDTIRVSLTADPVEEVRVGWEILKSLKLRRRGVSFVSCPTCARREYDVVAVTGELERRLAHISKPVTLAIMGCIVNGPGEARMADIGLAGQKGGRLALYVKGKLAKRIPRETAVEAVEAAVEEFLRKP